MVNVIGLGYIGLPTALMLASHGVKVVGADHNEALVKTLRAGKTTFQEKGLDELFASALAAGIEFTNKYQVTDTYIVSVPTPYDKFSKKIRLSAKYPGHLSRDALHQALVTERERKEYIPWKKK